MSAHPITPGTEIPFPCWLWREYVCASKSWFYEPNGWPADDMLALGYTHYSTNGPDQRPEDVVIEQPLIRPEAAELHGKVAEALFPEQLGVASSDAKISDLAIAIAREFVPERDDALWESDIKRVTAIIARKLAPIEQELAAWHGLLNFSDEKCTPERVAERLDYWTDEGLRAEQLEWKNEKLKEEVERWQKLTKAANERFDRMMFEHLTETKTESEIKAIDEAGAEREADESIVDLLRTDLRILRARVAELEKDKERLDWLEDNYVHLVGYNPYPDMSGKQWVVRKTSSVKDKPSHEASLRAAIDAAKEGKKL